VGVDSTVSLISDLILINVRLTDLTRFIQGYILSLHDCYRLLTQGRSFTPITSKLSYILDGLSFPF